MQHTKQQYHNHCRKGLLTACIVGLVAGLPFTRSASAQTLASNFGAGFALSTPGTPGNNISGPTSLIGSSSAAVEFTLGGNDATFSTAQMEMQRIFQQPDGVTVALDTNLNGLPGSTLETFAVNGISDNGGGSLLTVHSAQHSLLKANTSYWLVATGDGAQWSVWLQNAAGSFDPTLVSTGGGWRRSGGAAPVFQISGVVIPRPVPAVPEPGSAALLSGLAVSTLAFAAVRLRHSRSEARSAKL